MYLPVIRGVIARRILVNYRVEPEFLERILPAPFRPQLVQGCGIAGICLIRLKHIGPRVWPSALGFSSENAAHRIAVEWDEDGRTHSGVYIPRRDTNSRLNVFLGGRLLPGVHHQAIFRSKEQSNHVELEVNSRDGATRVLVRGRPTTSLATSSAFKSTAEASAFFEAGSRGYSPARVSGAFDGLELRTLNWHLNALEIDRVESSFFDDPTAFPVGSVHFDSAFWMREVHHEWRVRDLNLAPCIDRAA